MPIANVIQRSNTVTVYDEKNRYLWSRSVGSGPNDGVAGYTAGQVNIRNGKTITSYDEKGRYISSRSC